MQTSSRAIARIGSGALLALLALSGPAAAGNVVNTGLFGGVAINSFLWLVLIVALIVAILAMV